MSPIERLSKTELNVTKELTRGYLEKQIADHLCVSYKTVRTHTYNIRKKLNARNAVDVARIYLLSLKDPKKFMLMIAFLGIQSFATLSIPDMDLRTHVRTNSRLVRTSRKTQ